MTSSRFTRRITAAFACLAILMAALAPSISHALSDSGKSRFLWSEICSSAGLKLIKLDLGPASPTHGEPASAFDHCPFCQTHGGMPALPSSVAFVLPAYQGSFPFPSLFYQAPRPLFVWASPQSRAPPAQS
ncbi:DUF2946 domain-containing protein [Janthinobacterium sp. 17J80-10]|uniref:DUF2946 domain-containing protein n=1 Tax=Janthinobacterium sp. 17J80-10 TaxID=2497863 RepID=UPI0010052941|nr:DUF2946 domain-containing protein [Janthinobacterium sp. 17J80-10]QAU34999.1 DUF2946 domain-containing protein [Janthinobacterium sp. 17J80-10]